MKVQDIDDTLEDLEPPDYHLSSTVACSRYLQLEQRECLLVDEMDGEENQLERRLFMVFDPSSKKILKVSACQKISPRDALTNFSMSHLHEEIEINKFNELVILIYKRYSKVNHLTFLQKLSLHLNQTSSNIYCVIDWIKYPDQAWRVDDYTKHGKGLSKTYLFKAKSDFNKTKYVNDYLQGLKDDRVSELI